MDTHERVSHVTKQCLYSKTRWHMTVVEKGKVAEKIGQGSYERSHW